MENCKDDAVGLPVKERLSARALKPLHVRSRLLGQLVYRIAIQQICQTPNARVCLPDKPSLRYQGLRCKEPHECPVRRSVAELQLPTTPPQPLHHLPPGLAAGRQPASMACLWAAASA
eukprot:CAMPEP_0197912630 /NCGR_PEP_ID=MMETSP1439-20131203/75145_1 /TAXON_ID=66791 /ORGANISM="Gonyaulax spinifera, Strain CCMP409" /LENGTH=117 /DNA_ID=CAMNT_0043534437 /DNA_START=641 /DNA_END=990 /DNA_ORIENTATION=-